MIKYWKKGDELHIQKGFEWGNDLTCVEDGEMGTYVPMSDAEHIQGGIKKSLLKKPAKWLKSLAMIWRKWSKKKRTI